MPEHAKLKNSLSPKSVDIFEISISSANLSTPPEERFGKTTHFFVWLRQKKLLNGTARPMKFIVDLDLLL
jgi:hypothetical protein